MKHILLAIVVLLAFSLSKMTEVSAHPAWGIVVDRDHQVYFSDLETIWKIDTRGKLTKFRPGVAGRHVHEITLAEDGMLFGVDNSYEPTSERFISALWNMTPSGQFSYVLAPTHNPPKGMTNWVDRAGNRYYVARTDDKARKLFVLRRTRVGSVTTIAGDRKAGDAYRQEMLYSIGAGAFGKDGSLYFTDDANVRKLSTDGRLALVAGDIKAEDRATNSLYSRPTSLFGIALDTKDNVFVADYDNRRVLRIERVGAKQSTVVTSEQPWSPTGVAWKDDNVYVLESGFTPPTSYATRVRKVASDGKITVLATVGEKLSARVSENTEAGGVESVSRTPVALFYFLMCAAISIFGWVGVAWGYAGRQRRRSR